VSPGPLRVRAQLLQAWVVLVPGQEPVSLVQLSVGWKGVLGAPVSSVLRPELRSREDLPKALRDQELSRRHELRGWTSDPWIDVEN